MIDLNKLEENLDNSLEKETKESLTKFINKQREMREEGYYFVKYKGKQEIAYFTPETTTSFEYWLKIQEKYEDLSIMRKYWFTSDFDEIGDKIELPKN